MRPLLLALLLTLGSLAAYGQAPDCQFTQTFTATGYGVTVSNQAVANLGTQCVTWRLSYYADNMTALSIQVEGAPDSAGAPGTFAAVPTTACSSTQQPPCTLDGANALTDANHATVAFRGYYAWMALNVTVFTPTGSPAKITARMYGYKGTSPSASVQSGGASGNFVPYTGATGDVALGAHGITGAPFTGDSGIGGTTGLVPAPAAGDAAAGKYLAAGGGYAVPPGTGNAAYYQTVDNAGTPLTQRPTLNFTGSGVSCADNSGATRTDCTITGGGSSGAGSTVFSSTTTAGPNDSAAETSVIGTVTGSKTVAANTFTDGAVLQAHAQGFFSLPAISDSLTLKMKCGSTVIGSAVLTPGAGVLTNGSWRFWLDIATRGTGAGGAFITNGLAELTGSGLTDTTAQVLNTTTVAYDFTTACVFDITAQWGAAQVGETLQGTNVAAWFPGGQSSGSGSPAVVYASQISGIHLNGSLSANTGTDDKAALQTVLNTATATTPLLLIMDGVSAVDTSTVGLVVKSHTEIRCLAWNAGFSWLGSSNLHQQPLFTNANPLGIATPTDTDITIRGCALNGNATVGHGGIIAHGYPAVNNNSDGIFLAVSRMVGVTHLVADMLSFINCPGLNFHAGNITDFLIQNLTFSDVGSYGVGGVQFEGPDSNGIIRNISGTTPDDLIALNADDGHLASCTGLTSPGMFGDNSLASTLKSGPITDVLVDGLFPIAAFEAFRLLSATSLIDRVTVRNVSGTVFGHIFSADIFPPCFLGVYSGNFGDVRVENVNVSPSAITNEYGLYAISLLATYRSMKLDMSLEDYTPVSPVVLATTLSQIDTLDMTVNVKSATANPAAFMSMTGGNIHHLSLRGFYSSDTQSTNPLLDLTGGSLSILHVNDLFANSINNVVYQHGGSLNTILFSGGAHTSAAFGSGTVNQSTGNTILNSVVSGWATQLFHEGAGSITNSYAGVASDVVYTNSLTIGLVAYWHLTEPSGASRADSTGNGHTLANFGTVGQASATPLAGNVASYPGGSSNYLSTPGSAFTINPSTGVTFSGWVNLSTLTGTPIIVCKSYGGGGDFEFLVDYDSTSSQLSATVNGSSPGSTAFSAVPSPASTGTWYFIAAGWSPVDGKVFISVNNGTVYKGALVTPYPEGYDGFEVGSDQHVPLGYTGLLGHFGYWGRVLSAAEITTLYNGGAFYDPI